MSQFAKLDENNLVTEVIVGDSAMTPEQALQFITDTFGGTWLQTSYTGAIRYNFAGIGYSYNATADAFIAPQPYASWLLDTSNYTWQAPVPYPSDGNAYLWDEEIINWVEM